MYLSLDRLSRQFGSIRSYEKGYNESWDARPDLVREIDEYASYIRALEAIKRLTGDRVKKETVSIRDAYGRVAAEDIASPSNVPDRSRSHMDGYAVITSDLKGASSRSPRVLLLKGSARAGGGKRSMISSGETMNVVTGESLPANADAVAPVEEIQRVGRTVVFTMERRGGDYCYTTGADLMKGDTALARGRTIRAQDVGLLALLGVATVEVYLRPRVALIATGSELTAASGASDPSKVRESHIPIFENLIRENGGEPVVVGIVRDEISRIALAVKHALRTSEMVLTLGGTSLGDRDLVERALQRVAQNSQIIHGIRIDRGRVAGVAEVKGRPVIMLPGPVQAAMNAFVLFGIPSISRLAGKSGASDPMVTARLAKDWEARKRFANFTKVLYVRLERGKRGFVALPVVKETESMSVLTGSNGYIVVPERTVKLRAGTEVSVRILPGFSYVRGRFLDAG